jgi:hypothetical protein
MKKLLAIAMLGLVSLPAQAICVFDGDHTYGGDLDAADHVFVATITKATLVDDPASLPSRAVAGRRSMWHRYQIEYEFSVLSVLKGDPTAVGRLEGGAVYDPPDGSDARIAESIAWQPGDVVLVVANGNGPAELSFCGPSKPFDWAMSELIEEGRHDLDQFLPARK